MSDRIIGRTELVVMGLDCGPGDPEAGETLKMIRIIEWA